MSRIPGDSQAEAISPIHRIFHTSQSDIVRLGLRIGIHSDFKPFYNLGLVNFAKGNWYGAALAFRRSIELRDRYPWKNEYTEALTTWDVH